MAKPSKGGDAKLKGLKITKAKDGWSISASYYHMCSKRHCECGCIS